MTKNYVVLVVLCGVTYSTLKDSIKLGFEIFFLLGINDASYVNI